MTWTAQCCDAAPVLQEHLVHFSIQRIAFPSVHRGETTRAKRAHPCESAIANISSVDLNQAVNKWLNIYWKNIVKDYSLTFHSEVPFPVCKHGGRKCAAKSCIFGDISCINISTFKPRLVYKPLKNLSLEHGTSISPRSRHTSRKCVGGCGCAMRGKCDFSRAASSWKNARGYNELVFLHNNQG